MLGCLLFKKFTKFNESCSLSKAARMSSECHLLMLDVVLAILAKLVIIFKLGLTSISKRTKSLIFLKIYTPLQSTLTYTILFVLKLLMKLTLNLT